tara:strand:- start:116 stop:1987 length:1872 start_codon:yes stop_codon:yes gene_type:complete
MSKVLPVIVGFGGYNSAGRSSFHQGFKRTIIESLNEADKRNTILSLACLMGLVSWKDDAYISASGEFLDEEEVVKAYEGIVLAGTLIREIEHFDSRAIPGNKKINFSSEKKLVFKMLKRDLPEHPPKDWKIKILPNSEVEVTSSGKTEFFVSSHYELSSKAAGQLPKGFCPESYYTSRFHPRGLQMAILGVNDALNSVGIPWDLLSKNLSPNEVGVYSSSVFGQVNEEAFGGLFKSRLRGDRTTSKQVPLALNSMPADFINAYVLGNIGHTEATTGACASFLYTVNSALRDIQAGRCRLAVVGNSEAPITPEMSEGLSSMSALVTEDGLKRIDGLDKVNWRSSSRPFGENCGFTLAEASQYIILMDDKLALELGAIIYGAFPGVFVNADGIKKSISAPGAGNYLCFARAVSSAISLLGEKSIQNNSFVHAHGSSTPANRTTESEVLDSVAEAFDIFDWPVAAVKSYVGHSMAAASGDQVVSALGTFSYQVIPGIKTIDRIAKDVSQERLSFLLHDKDVSSNPMDVAFINSKGFGGNNASGYVISPKKSEELLMLKYSDKDFSNYLTRREVALERASTYCKLADRGDLDIIYKFGEEQIEDSKIKISKSGISIPGYEKDILFDE